MSSDLGGRTPPVALGALQARGELRNTRLKRSWHDADTCSSSVELILSTVTAPQARMVAFTFREYANASSKERTARSPIACM